MKLRQSDIRDIAFAFMFTFLGAMLGFAVGSTIHPVPINVDPVVIPSPPAAIPLDSPYGPADVVIDGGEYVHSRVVVDLAAILTEVHRDAAKTKADLATVVKEAEQIINILIEEIRKLQMGKCVPAKAPAADPSI